MRLFVGLGNPGSKYENNRHNIGFMAVDEIVRRHNFLPDVGDGKKRWQSLTHEGRLGATKIVIIKPQTFMNESGRAVGEAMRFFKLNPADVVVFYDELDLAFGKVKAKLGGGSAGHNGIKSIAAHIGPDFERVRLGIGHPGDKARVHGHVLGDFAKSELGMRDDMVGAAAEAAAWMADGDRARFLTEVSSLINPPRPSSGVGPKVGAHSDNKKTAPKAAKTEDKPQSGSNASNNNAVGGVMASALKALADKLKGEK